MGIWKEKMPVLPCPKHIFYQVTEIYSLPNSPQFQQPLGSIFFFKQDFPVLLQWLFSIDTDRDFISYWNSITSIFLSWHNISTLSIQTSSFLLHFICHLEKKKSLHIHRWTDEHKEIWMDEWMTDREPLHCQSIFNRAENCGKRRNACKKQKANFSFWKTFNLLSACNLLILQISVFERSFICYIQM